MSDRQIIWPVYLDSTKSRGQGRVISREKAVEEPVLEEIRRAAEELGLNPVVEPEKSYPKEWWEESGRVVVDRVAPKSVTVGKIAESIEESR